MQYLSLKQILLIHSILIDETGGAHGVREMIRLQSVVNAVKQRVYKTTFEKASVYMRGIIQDHPFVDGNKRTGVVAAVIFLKLNGLSTKFKLEEIENFAVRAALDKLTINEISNWLEKHSE